MAARPSRVHVKGRLHMSLVVECVSCLGFCVFLVCVCASVGFCGFFSVVCV